MSDPETLYHLLEQKLKEKLEPEGITVMMGRKGLSTHANGVKAVFIVPARETFTAGIPSEDIPHPPKTCNIIPVLTIRALDITTVVSLRDKVIGVLDVSFHGAYTMGTGVWYGDDAQTVAGEEYKLPVQLSGPVGSSEQSTTDLATVTSTSSAKDVLFPPEAPPSSSWSPAESQS